VLLLVAQLLSGCLRLPTLQQHLLLTYLLLHLQVLRLLPMMPAGRLHLQALLLPWLLPAPLLLLLPPLLCLLLLRVPWVGEPGPAHQFSSGTHGTL
jgi:hypothetical protein